MNPFDLMNIDRNFLLFERFPQLFITDRLLRLLLQRTNLVLQLTEQIMNTQQVLLRLIQLASGVFFTRFIFNNP
ncbi:hypothetical protein D3C80_1847280 [compost metagenome]